MPLTPKENFLNAINHKETERVPVMLVDCAVVGFGGFPGPWIEKGPLGGGYDGFGVRWVNPASGGGAPIPAPNEHVLDLDDILNWKEIVKFPDLEAIDWEEMANAEFKMIPIDRNLQAVEFGCGNGVFERLAALMGFEHALMALIEEPEACYELMEAITDYKIEFAKKVKKYYDPDLFTNYDDIATERGLFMSPETYRQLIKPHHKRLNDAVRELGMIPVQHTCGYCEQVVEDFIETGAEVWTSVQPTNDIVSLQKKYGDRFVFMGGFDTNGAPAQEGASWEVVTEEIRRCIDIYGAQPGFIFFGYILQNTLDPQKKRAALMPFFQEVAKYSREGAATKSAGVHPPKD